MVPLTSEVFSPEPLRSEFGQSASEVIEPPGAVDVVCCYLFVVCFDWLFGYLLRVFIYLCLSSSLFVFCLFLFQWTSRVPSMCAIVFSQRFGLFHWAWFRRNMVITTKAKTHWYKKNKTQKNNIEKNGGLTRYSKHSVHGLQAHKRIPALHRSAAQVSGKRAVGSWSSTQPKQTILVRLAWLGLSFGLVWFS